MTSMANIENFKLTGLFLFGAVGYGAIEITVRGFTHWTMILTGGAALVTLYLLNRQFPDAAFVTKCVAGGFVITIYEFAVGCIVNLWFGWNVWDYSHYPLNLWGQICPLFTFIWFVLCAILLLLKNLLHQLAYQV